MKQKITNFVQRGPFFWFWLLPVWVVLGICRAVILTTHFRHYSRGLGKLDGATPRQPAASKPEEILAKKIGTVIKTAARYSPWEANCFAQAVTARMLLGLYKVPYAIVFGLQKGKDIEGERNLKAHAWVVCGSVNVTGGRGFAQYVPVSCFVSRQ